MGLDVYRSTRIDRLRGSRVLSMLNDAPLDSEYRLQLVKVDFSALGPISAAGRSYYNIEGILDQQRVTNFLAASLRLAPADVTQVIRYFNELQLTWDDIGGT